MILNFLPYDSENVFLYRGISMLIQISHTRVANFFICVQLVGL